MGAQGVHEDPRLLRAVAGGREDGMDGAAQQGPCRQQPYQQARLHMGGHSNVTQYGAWQAYFRRAQPPALVVWGKNDPLFTPAGALAFHKDLPKAEVKLLDTGHFALEEDHAEIAASILAFADKSGLVH